MQGEDGELAVSYQPSAFSADNLIRERLRREGRMTFAAFMEAALYGPGGYYAERPAFGGEGGDFFTSAELHPVFGALLGRQVAQAWEALGRPSAFDVVEQGPGSGALCRDLLTWADYEAPVFARAVRYLLVESSAPLRSAQRDTLAAAGLLDDRVGWDQRSALDFEGEIVGCILANELADAFPVHLVTVRDGCLLERYVALAGDDLTFVEDGPSTPELAAYFSDLGLLPGEGCVAEVNPRAVRWMQRAAASLERGLVLVLDYGYPARELYAPHRRYGTLLCYRGHTVSSDPLAHPGGQDITSHVDFTSLARAGERAGLAAIGLTDQATFLTNLGLRAYLRALDRAGLSALEHDANRRALLELIREDGLGAVKVLIQARGLPDLEPIGLRGKADPGFPESPGADGGLDSITPWVPLLRMDQMRLPSLFEAEGFGDLETQWREFWGGQDDDDIRGGG